MLSLKLPLKESEGKVRISDAIKKYLSSNYKKDVVKEIEPYLVKLQEKRYEAKTARTTKSARKILEYVQLLEYFQSRITLVPVISGDYVEVNYPWSPLTVDRKGNLVSKDVNFEKASLLYNLGAILFNAGIKELKLSAYTSQDRLKEGIRLVQTASTAFQKAAEYGTEIDRLPEADVSESLSTYCLAVAQYGIYLVAKLNKDIKSSLVSKLAMSAVDLFSKAISLIPEGVHYSGVFPLAEYKSVINRYRDVLLCHAELLFCQDLADDNKKRRKKRDKSKYAKIVSRMRNASEILKSTISRGQNKKKKTTKRILEELPYDIKPENLLIAVENLMSSMAEMNTILGDSRAIPPYQSLPPIPLHQMAKRLELESNIQDYKPQQYNFLEKMIPVEVVQLLPSFKTLLSKFYMDSCESAINELDNQFEEFCTQNSISSKVINFTDEANSELSKVFETIKKIEQFQNQIDFLNERKKSINDRISYFIRKLKEEVDSDFAMEMEYGTSWNLTSAQVSNRPYLARISQLKKNTEAAVSSWDAVSQKFYKSIDYCSRYRNKSYEELRAEIQKSKTQGNPASERLESLYREIKDGIKKLRDTWKEKVMYDDQDAVKEEFIRFVLSRDISSALLEIKNRDSKLKKKQKEKARSEGLEEDSITEAEARIFRDFVESKLTGYTEIDSEIARLRKLIKEFESLNEEYDEWESEHRESSKDSELVQHLAVLSDAERVLSSTNEKFGEIELEMDKLENDVKGYLMQRQVQKNELQQLLGGKGTVSQPSNNEASVYGGMNYNWAGNKEFESSIKNWGTVKKDAESSSDDDDEQDGPVGNTGSYNWGGGQGMTAGTTNWGGYGGGGYNWNAAPPNQQAGGWQGGGQQAPGWGGYNWSGNYNQQQGSGVSWGTAAPGSQPGNFGWNANNGRGGRGGNSNPGGAYNPFN